jgi:hypothetical protein
MKSTTAPRITKRHYDNLAIIIPGIIYYFGGLCY